MKILWLGLEKSLGVPDTLCMNKNTFDLGAIGGFQPDLIIEREFNVNGLSWEKELPQLKQLLPNAVTAVWLIDSHVRAPFHHKYCQLFDYAFFAISSFVPEMEHERKYWLPVCFTGAPEDVRDGGERKHKFGFIGSHGTAYLEERTEFYRLIKDIYPDFYIKKDYTTLFQSMATIEYIVNLSYNGDMNFRTFESLGSGCGLITSDVPDLYKIQGLTDRISIFKDFDECVALIQACETEPARSHSEWVQKNHTLANRVEAIKYMIAHNTQMEF